MIIDLSAIPTAIVTVAAAAISAAVPILIPAILKRLHIANDATLTAKVTVAADAAAGIAYQYAASVAGGLTHVDVHNQALALGAQYVAERVPQTLAALGITPDAVAQMVSARLGVLLASDPTVTAGQPSPAATPAVTPAPSPSPTPAPAFPFSTAWEAPQL